MGDAEEVITRGITGIDFIELGCSVIRCSRAMIPGAGLQGRSRGHKPDAALGHRLFQGVERHGFMVCPLVRLL